MSPIACHVSAYAGLALRCRPAPHGPDWMAGCLGARIHVTTDRHPSHSGAPEFVALVLIVTRLALAGRGLGDALVSSNRVRSWFRERRRKEKQYRQAPYEQHLESANQLGSLRARRSGSPLQCRVGQVDSGKAFS
jgi:hypothetical protein